MTTEDINQLAAEKVRQFQKELEELGFASALFYRTPGAATAPVLHLLIGETEGDVEEARTGTRI